MHGERCLHAAIRCILQVPDIGLLRKRPVWVHLHGLSGVGYVAMAA
jgi:hypothetical protein